MNDERTAEEKRAKRDAHRVEADFDDAVDETKHRVAAAAERGKRAVAGDAMTASEKLKSRAKEAGHDIAAGTDKTKRKLRDKFEK